MPTNGRTVRKGECVGIALHLGGSVPLGLYLRVHSMGAYLGLLGSFLCRNAFLLLNLRHGCIVHLLVALTLLCLLLFTDCTLALVHKGVNPRPCAQCLLRIRHLCVVLLHGGIVVGIGLLLCLNHCHGRAFERRCFLGRLFLLQCIECLLRLLHLRIDNGCGVGIVAACNLVECVKGCLLVGFLKHGFASLLIKRNTLQCSRLAVGLFLPALLILLQHLLVMLLHLLNLLLWKCNATIALRGLVESTLVLLQLLVCHGLLHVLALILYVFWRFLYAFIRIWYAFIIASTTKHGLMLGLNVGISLVKFGLWVDGITEIEDLVGTGELVFACLGIANHNALVGVLRVDTCTIGKRHDITFYYIYRLVVHLHGGWLHHAVVLVGMSLHVGGYLPALVLHRIVGSVLHSVHRCLGIDVVEHCVLLVFRQFGVVGQCPRIILHLGHAHFRVSAESVLTFLQCLLHTKNNGIHIGFCVRIALLHLVPQQARLVIDGRSSCLVIGHGLLCLLVLFWEQPFQIVLHGCLLWFGALARLFLDGRVHIYACLFLYGRTNCLGTFCVCHASVLLHELVNGIYHLSIVGYCVLVALLCSLVVALDGFGVCTKGNGFNGCVPHLVVGFRLGVTLTYINAVEFGLSHDFVLLPLG